MEEFRIDPTIAYDVVELPSRGIHYPSGKKSVKVAYLTAADENILASPNLIATNTVVNELINRKVLDHDLKFDDIVEEDRQAILIFLRNTAFGSEYNMTITDPKTNEQFNTVVDLSNVPIKEFNLVADANNEYPYYFERSKVDVTFTFLTQKQEDELQKIKDSWNGNGVAPIITKKLEMMIKSIGGNRNQMEIRNLIERLPIKDSQDFRKFISDIKPGLNLIKDVTTPSGDIVQVEVGFGVEFFRPFYGL
jgi:hypothetical protein